MTSKSTSTQSEKADDSTPNLPTEQVCAKCEAEFRWEPSDPTVKGSPLVARLTKPSDDCDCGYGSVAKEL